MTSTGSGIIYIGVWTNWSNGNVWGRTLTLTQKDGAILTAFVALFVAFTGACLWRLICFALHQMLSSNESHGGQYHHRQLILRNSASSAAGLWITLQVLWTWKRHGATMSKWLPLLGLCSISAAALALASIFSSKISTGMGDEVLLKSPHCGKPEIPQWGWINDGRPHTWIAGISINRVESSIRYAQECYTNITGNTHFEDNSYQLNPCNAYIKPQIAIKFTKNEPCPFNERNICRFQDENIVMDARLNSLDDLGLNTRREESVDFRWRDHCGPIKATEFRRLSNTSGQETVEYYYGPAHRKSSGTSKQFTFSSPRQDLRMSEVPISSVYNAPGLVLLGVLARLENGNVSYKDSTFEPIPSLTVPDGDVFLAGAAQNWAQYDSPITDGWLSVNKSVKFSDAVYIPDEEVSSMGCVSRMQICTPSSPESQEKVCTGLGSILDVFAEASSPDRRGSDIILRVFQSLAVVSMAQIPIWLQAHSMKYIANSPALRVWREHVLDWQRTFLASVQGSVIDGVIGVSPQEEPGIWTVANTIEEKKFCNSQKVRSLSHSNFSVFWLSLIFAIGSLAFILNWTVEPFLVWLNKQRDQQRWKYSLTEWALNGTFQLQRLSNEELGYGGSWTRCDEEIPIPETDKFLANIDLTNKQHPRLYSARSNDLSFTMQPSTKATSDSDGLQESCTTQTGGSDSLGTAPKTTPV